VPKTLLAVDDSATMRKVLEITFAGEDMRVVTADGAASALAKMSEEPVAVVIDTSLGDGDGYALAKEVRGRDPRVVILLMASRYNPYDAARGKDAGVDDFIDKPFDTQAFIDKLKKATAVREAGKGAAVVAPPAPPAPAPQPAPAPAPAAAPVAAHVVPQFAGTPRPPVVAPAAARGTFPTQRTHTLSFEGSGAAAPPPPPVTAPPAHPVVPPISRTAPSGVPVFTPAAAPPAAPAPPPPPPPPQHAPAAVVARPTEPSAVAAVVNGQFAGKLGDLGLSAAQVEAVLALSREVVERVVWEVVPQLAETIIKEELARLTRD
jgi:CheY-like chemotaxis protein